ncbi:hypothetical protein CKY51_11535 [Xanthomonas maliensis]|nr:hypothetical protein CKY51_11535 [Xanthomonas maliensis]
MKFIREDARLQSSAEQLLQALMGHMTLTFGESDLDVNMPDIEVTVAGDLRKFAGFNERKPYKVIFCGESTVVWSAKRSFGSVEETTTSNFVGPDTVWVYTGSTSPGVPDLHAREYFQRAR